ncbi:hypothetical protein AFI02nite_06410 [Aliivibrio fischeri]|uniref:Uncharacterized protein n=1 Tax=Aliivibrio fischeri TaxID=668 RepID=A0A510UI06_ALIFS|nr:hypothetical protein AFI02nite_06410 [Aliivibrio fischeri]
MVNTLGAWIVTPITVKLGITLTINATSVVMLVKRNCHLDSRLSGCFEARRHENRKAKAKAKYEVILANSAIKIAVDSLKYVSNGD